MFRELLILLVLFAASCAYSVIHSDVPTTNITGDEYLQCFTQFLPGRCPKVQTVKDFNITRIYGMWYMVSQYQGDPRYTDTGKRCITTDFMSDVPGDVPCRVKLTSSSVDEVTGKRTQQPGWIVAPDVNNKGHLIQTMSEDGVPHTWYPIATDYDTYLATHTCQQFPQDCPVGHRQHSYIFMRDRVFSKEKYHNILTSFAKFGIDIDWFHMVNNTNCDEPESEPEPEPEPKPEPVKPSYLNKI